MVQHERYQYKLEGTMFKKEGKRFSQEMHLTTSLWLHKISEVLNYILVSRAVLEFFNDILFSKCTELVWHAGKEHTLSLENITQFKETSQIQNTVGACRKGRKLIMIWLLNRSRILPEKISWYSTNLDLIKESILGHVTVWTLLQKACWGQVKIQTLPQEACWWQVKIWTL